MRKLSLFLLGCFIAVAIAPMVFAKSDKPVYIKAIDAYTRLLNQGITADVTVCASDEDAKFEVKVLNTVTNAMYSRKLLIRDGGCMEFKLGFNDNFSQISKAGDKLKFTLMNIQMNGDKYAQTSPQFAVIQDKSAAKEPCGNVAGQDDVYNVCAGDFITHTPTGVRIKVVSIDRDKVELIITGVQWGGPAKLSVYKDRAKEVVAKNLTRVNITNVGLGGGMAELQIES